MMNTTSERDDMERIAGTISAPEDIRALVADFASAERLTRVQARSALIAMGGRVIPFLAEALEHPRRQVRWEVAKTLASMKNPSTAPLLVKLLEDSVVGVRWVAANGLLALGGKVALPPLLRALVHRGDSSWLREGAHHVLRGFVGSSYEEEAISVLQAIDSVEPELGVPQAAWDALESLERAEAA